MRHCGKNFAEARSIRIASTRISGFGTSIAAIAAGFAGGILVSISDSDGFAGSAETG